MEGRPNTKKGIVYSELKQQIINNQIPGDKPLTVKALCSQYDVSRTTIREVLEMLISEGFLMQMRGAGYFVKLIDYQDMVEIYELREVLEVLAVKLFVERLNPERKGHFKEYVRLQEKAYWKDDHENFMRLDMKIHALIAEGARNRKLENALKSIYSQIQLMAAAAQDDAVVRKMASQSHSMLLENIERHDVQGAQKVMQQHVAEVRDYHKSRYYLYTK